MSNKLDLSKCKVGDKVLHRDGSISVIDEVDTSYDTYFPYHSTKGWFKESGEWCYSDLEDNNEKDIVSIVNEPEQKEQSEKTLRDEFAMAAIQGLLSDNDVSFETNKEIATACYALADAMMKARDEK